MWRNCDRRKPSCHPGAPYYFLESIPMVDFIRGLYGASWTLKTTSCPFSTKQKFDQAKSLTADFRCSWKLISIWTMEVASPLAFVSSSAGSKRGLSCSPQLMESTNHANPESDLFQRSHKRRRFHADTSVESLSNAFAAPSSFFNNSLQSQGLGSPLGMFPH